MSVPGLRTSIFTFGYDHHHEVRGVEFGYWTPVRITAPDPRAVMAETFGRDWAFEYSPEDYAAGSMGGDEQFKVVDLP